MLTKIIKCGRIIAEKSQKRQAVGVGMKKRYIIIFLIITAVNFLCKLLIPSDISDLRALVFTVFSVVMPLVYVFGAIIFSDLSWKTVGVVSGAILASGGVMVLFAGDNPPLGEFGWISTQIPFLIYSFIAGYFTFSAKTKDKRIKTFAGFVPPLILAFIFFYSFFSILISWGNSSM